MIEIIADTFAKNDLFETSRFEFLKMNLWNTRTFKAAIINKIILSQKVGSTPRVSALVMNSKIPDGMISHKPLRDHGSK